MFFLASWTREGGVLLQREEHVLCMCTGSLTSAQLAPVVTKRSTDKSEVIKKIDARMYVEQQGLGRRRHFAPLLIWLGNDFGW